MEKYKHHKSEGWFIYFDKNGLEYPAFTKDNRPGMYEDMMKWVADGNEIEPAVTAEEQAIIDAEQAEYEKVKYKDLRRSEYPPIEDQLDYIYWNGLEAWKNDIIKPVKEKYPKP